MKVPAKRHNYDIFLLCRKVLILDNISGILPDESNLRVFVLNLYFGKLFILRGIAKKMRSVSKPGQLCVNNDNF